LIESETSPVAFQINGGDAGEAHVGLGCEQAEQQHARKRNHESETWVSRGEMIFFICEGDNRGEDQLRCETKPIKKWMISIIYFFCNWPREYILCWQGIGANRMAGIE